MVLRKSSLGIGKSRIHFWDDTELSFRAECFKRDGMWVAGVGPALRMDASYQDAVDWVMDQYRLARAGLESWDGPAVVLANADGMEWDSMTHAERVHYISKARKAAREQGGV